MSKKALSIIFINILLISCATNRQLIRENVSEEIFTTKNKYALLKDSEGKFLSEYYKEGFNGNITKINGVNANHVVNFNGDDFHKIPEGKYDLEIRVNGNGADAWIYLEYEFTNNFIYLIQIATKDWNYVAQISKYSFDNPTKIISKADVKAESFAYRKKVFTAY